MDAERGIPFTAFTSSEKERMSVVVSDVDDTITSNGRLFPSALDSIWKLHESGRKIILVTGGSAGWADIYIRQWPVDYVIAESGALLLTLNKNNLGAMDVIYKVNPSIDAKSAARFKSELLKATGDYALSSDQYARIYDIAYDKSKNSNDSIDRIKDIVLSLGGNYAESSIHLNCWYGDYDKKDGIISFLPEISSLSVDEFISSSIYLGDSTNDQILFGFFPLSIGMHSVEDRRSDFKALPLYITREYGGDGFVAIVDALLR